MESFINSDNQLQPENRCKLTMRLQVSLFLQMWTSKGVLKDTLKVFDDFKDKQQEFMK